MNPHPGPYALALLSTILALTIAVNDVHGQAAATPATIVQEQVEKLMSGDLSASASARDALVDAVNPGGAGPKPTAPFLNAFAGALDSGIMPALKHESDMVRLNAAIALARVAERTDNAALAGSTIALLNDKSPFVVLWGLKAARSVIPAVLRNPAIKPDTILAAVVKAAEAHGSGAMGAPIAVEAYEALMLDIFDPARRKPTDAELRAVIPLMQQLLQQRAEMYTHAVPPEPLAEARGTLFIVNSRVWGLHDAKQKLASVQSMSNLISLGAQHFSIASNLRGDLAAMISNVASAIAVVPESATIQAQLAPAVKVVESTPPDSVLNAAAGVVPALKTVKAFDAIQPPPVVAAGAGSDGNAQPSTAPTTTGTAPAASATSS